MFLLMIYLRTWQLHSSGTQTKEKSWINSLFSHLTSMPATNPTKSIFKIYLTGPACILLTTPPGHTITSWHDYWKHLWTYFPLISLPYTLARGRFLLRSCLPSTQNSSVAFCLTQENGRILTVVLKTGPLACDLSSFACFVSAVLAWF